jgi:hypothetical protein
MLFQHAVACQLKVTGGCQMCKKMWALLNLHAKSCARSDCPVPRWVIEEGDAGLRVFMLRQGWSSCGVRGGWFLRRQLVWQ